jgi:hypothetical protein
VHGAKATARPVVNTTTAGFGAPIISTIEDVGSVALSLIAILSPVLVAVIVVAMIAGFWALIRRRRRRRDGRRFARTARTERS